MKHRGPLGYFGYSDPSPQILYFSSTLKTFGFEIKKKIEREIRISAFIYGYLFATRFIIVIILNYPLIFIIIFKS